MITLRVTADVKDDRRVVLTLPLDVPTGRAELVVTVESPKGKPPQPRGVPAAEIRGIAVGNGAPPDDETIKQWIHDRRMEKHG